MTTPRQASISRMAAGLVTVLSVVCACSSAHATQTAVGGTAPTAVPIVVCGQRLVSTVPGGSWGTRFVRWQPSSVAAGVSRSHLPPRVEPGQHVTRYSDLLRLSKGCGSGAVVVVSSSVPDLVTVAVAYAPQHQGIVALLLGTVAAPATSRAPAPVTGTLTAYRPGDIGHLRLRF